MCRGVIGYKWNVTIREALLEQSRNGGNGGNGEGEKNRDDLIKMKGTGEGSGVRYKEGGRAIWTIDLTP